MLASMIKPWPRGAPRCLSRPASCLSNVRNGDRSRYSVESPYHYLWVGIARGACPTFVEHQRPTLGCYLASGRDVAVVW